MKKVFLLLVIFLLVFIFYYFGGPEYLSFDYIKFHLNEIIRTYQDHPILIIGAFLFIYVLLTGLSIPGSIILTILAGAIFGTFFGVLLVGMAGTIGATISFMMSRFLMRDFVYSKFQKQFSSIDRNLKKDGNLFLLSIRMIPVSPFVVINLVMGLTKITIGTFIWTTFFGMIPGNLIYVYGGMKITKIDKPSEILTPEIIIALIFLGLLPFIGKKIFSYLKKKIIHV